MSDSIISIGLINGKFDIKDSNSKFISNLEKTKLILKPKTFKDLYNQIFFDSKFGENQVNQIIGFFPDGNKIYIQDKNYEDNKDKISIYLGCKQESPVFDKVIIDPKILDELEKIPVPSNKEFVKKQKIEIGELTSQLSSDIGKVQNNLFNSFIDEFDDSLNKNLEKSLNDLVLKVSTKNIQRVENLRNSVKIFSKKFLERANSCIYMSKQNSEEIKEVKKILEKKRTQIFDDKINNNNVIEEKVIEEKVIEEKVIEDEKVFEFCDNSISVEETKPNFELKNIRLRNNSKNKDYKSDILVWLKEDKSNEDLNFDQEEIKNEFPFVKDQSYPNQKEIDDLTLKLCIKEPKEQEYKMLLSIKDTQTQKTISKSPLEVTVKMKPEKKPEPIDLEKIRNNLKELEFFDLISDNKEEINKKIQDENGNVSQIKIWVMKEIENKKGNKINELLSKFQEEFNKTTAKGDESKQKEIILEKKFNEIEIKNWIEANKEKAPDPIPQPEPNPGQNPGSNDQAEEIYKRLDEEFVVNTFTEKEDVIAKIIEFGYDYERVKAWVEEQI